MKHPIRSAVSILTVCAAAVLGRAEPLRHAFLAIDEGMNNLLYIDQWNASKNWIVPIKEGHPRDMQLVGGGRLLISTDAGYNEYDIATGRILKEVARYHDISSARRLPNGHTLVAGVDFDGPKTNKGTSPVGDPTGRHIVVGDFDGEDHEVSRVTYVGDYVRIMRETAAETFLFGQNMLFKEGDGKGNFIWEIEVPGIQDHRAPGKPPIQPHAWMALRLPNGHTLMSSGYGTSQGDGSAFMVEVDIAGKVVRRFGDASQVPAEVHPYFYAMFQLLPSGTGKRTAYDVVVANWQGHGKNHGTSGVQVLEFDPKGAIVWQWSDSRIISSIQGILVLDGLDTQKLQDERLGVMAPLASQ